MFMFVQPTSHWGKNDVEAVSLCGHCECIWQDRTAKSARDRGREKFWVVCVVVHVAGSCSRLYNYKQKPATHWGKKAL